MPRTPDRRSFLRAASSAAAGASVSARVSLAAPPPQIDPLVTLEKRLQVAEQRWLDAIAARDQAEQRILDAGGGLPEPPEVLVGGEPCGSPEDVIAACRARKAAADFTFTVLLSDHLRRQRAAHEALRAALGLAAVDAAEHAAQAALDEAYGTFAAAPSGSLDGLAVKLRRARHEIGAEVFDLAEKLVASALADIERMRRA